MPMSTFQKVTLATCAVLCVSLLLPKMLLSRRKDAAERPDAAGRFPPGMHRQMSPETRAQKPAGSGFSRAPNAEATARTRGPGPGGKSNLAGQIIPVYGFGILLYILYILFKIMSKGSSQAAEGRFPPVRSENTKRKITDFQLAQLQEKLRETELVMEKIVSNAHPGADRVKVVSPDQEESLLQQLTEIRRVMQEGQLLDGVAPDGYPERSPPYRESPRCCCRHLPGRTQGDRISRVEDLTEDVTAGGEDPSAELVFKAASNEDVSAEMEDRGGPSDLDLPEEDGEAATVDQEETEDLNCPVDPETSCCVVRRRSRRRRMKKRPEQLTP